jgi:hypothetical protein
MIFKQLINAERFTYTANIIIRNTSLSRMGNRRLDAENKEIHEKIQKLKHKRV